MKEFDRQFMYLWCSSIKRAVRRNGPPLRSVSVCVAIAANEEISLKKFQSQRSDCLRQFANLRFVGPNSGQKIKGIK